jgi:hypothetical protein
MSEESLPPANADSHPILQWARNSERGRVHTALRETLENTLKFLTLSLLLSWAKTHTGPWLPRDLLQVMSILCVIPGALLRMICIFNDPRNIAQIIKELPVLGTSLRGDLTVYWLVIFLLVPLFIGLGYICTCADFR